LLSPRLFWFTIVVLATVLTYAFWRPITEERIAHAGALLQLVGTGMGFGALSATRKLFKLPSLMDEARAWVGRRPRRNRTVQLECRGFGTSASSVNMSLWSAMGSDLDASKRMDAMAANIEQLRKEAAEARAEHSAATMKIRKDMEFKTGAIEEGLSGTTLTLRESQTGGLWMAAVALIMLFIGTVFAGFPNLFCQLG
jgi:type II secretory pathway component PulM